MSQVGCRGLKNRAASTPETSHPYSLDAAVVVGETASPEGSEQGSAVVHVTIRTHQ